MSTRVDRIRANRKSMASLRQRIQQGLSLLQIERVEAFGEPVIDRSKQFARVVMLPLIAPQPGHAPRRAEFL